MSDASPNLASQIASQPRELERILNEPLDESAGARLRGADRFWLAGRGRSQHAAELGAMLFHAAGRDARAMSAMPFARWTPPLRDTDAVVVISHNAGTET